MHRATNERRRHGELAWHCASLTCHETGAAQPHAPPLARAQAARACGHRCDEEIAAQTWCASCWSSALSTIASKRESACTVCRTPHCISTNVRCSCVRTRAAAAAGSDGKTQLKTVWRKPGCARSVRRNQVRVARRAEVAPDGVPDANWRLACHSLEPLGVRRLIPQALSF